MPLKPNILVSGSTDEVSLSYYLDAVAAAGGVPHPAYCPAPDASYDGLLLCGGADIDPSRYGQGNTASRGIDLARDEAESRLAQAYLDAGKPILGVCRGMQLINVILGGTLLQDIGPERCAAHDHPEGGPDKAHSIRTAGDSVMRRLFGAAPTVNSSHHQALDRLGTGLAVTAWAGDGVAEAVEHPSLPLLCVQFHPERMCLSQRRPDMGYGMPAFQWLIERTLSWTN